MTRRTLLTLAPVAALALFVGCRARGPDLTPREGYVHVTGGRIWYRIVGTGKGIPLLVIHGGLTAPSYYLKSLGALGDERPVIFFDHLGAGKSDHPADTSLWHISGYLQRLAELRDSLGLKEVHLYGHSLGTLLAVDYALTKPQGLKSLILAGPALSSARFKHDDDSLRRTLPDSIQRILTEHERDHTTNAPEYQAAMMVFMHRFQSRANPWPPETDSTFHDFRRDTIPPKVMFGPGGDLEHGFDVTSRLHEIAQPTLIIAGRYDRATPATSAYYRSLFPHAELAILEHSAHVQTIDEPVRNVAVIRAFLDRVDAH